MPEFMDYARTASHKQYPRDWRRRRPSYSGNSSPAHAWATPVDDKFIEWKFKILTREPEPISAVQEKFHRLVKEWKKEAIRAHSLMSKIAMHPSYQRMVGMGEEALPFIFERLKLGDSPSQWFWALAAITEATPVPEESRGKVREMSKAWLRWGHERGYVKLD